MGLCRGTVRTSTCVVRENLHYQVRHREGSINLYGAKTPSNWIDMTAEQERKYPSQVFCGSLSTQPYAQQQLEDKTYLP